MKAKKILFITQEMTPYVPDSELAAMGRELPQEIQEKGREIRTFMPKWGNINERRNQLHEVIRLSGMNLIIDDTDHPLIIKVASIQAARMQVYFIDNDDYFLKRLMALDENGNEYEDNSERAIFYARGVLETVKKLRWVPDVIHCQGWMSALVPLYVKTAYKRRAFIPRQQNRIFHVFRRLETVDGHELRQLHNVQGRERICSQRLQPGSDIRRIEQISHQLFRRTDRARYGQVPSLCRIRTKQTDSGVGKRQCCRCRCFCRLLRQSMEPGQERRLKTFIILRKHEIQNFIHHVDRIMQRGL